MSTALIFSGLMILLNGSQSPNESNISNPKIPEIKHQAFRKGEKLNYKISYGWFDAGIATIEIKQEYHQINNRDALHIVGIGKSIGAFDWFFKVDDRYETYIDSEGVFPWLFVRDIHEGDFSMKQQYRFDQFKQTVTTQKKEVHDVPLGIQDMISSFYRARILDYAKAKPGDIFEFEAFVDDKIWPLKIKYLKNEHKVVGDKKFDCMVFVPVVQTGRIFKNEEDMKVWITRDANKIPVMAEAKILVGSITMQLTNYSGLANNIAIIKD